jgi:cellulose synthase (UDP-forming)
MRLFFWDNPVFKKGLRWRQRLSHLLIGLSYLCSGFVLPFFFVVPIWAYLTGGSVLYGHEVEFAVIRGLYFVSMTIAMHFLFRGQQAAREFQMLAGLFPIYVWATLKALAYPPSRKPRYRANNLGAQTFKPWTFRIVIPQLIVLTANALLPFHAALRATATGRLIAMNVVVSALVIWSLLPVLFGTFGKHHHPKPEEVVDGGYEIAG